MSGDWTRCLNDAMTGGASSVRCSPVMQTATATCTCFRWGGVLLGEEQSPGCQGLTDGIARKVALLETKVGGKCSRIPNSFRRGSCVVKFFSRPRRPSLL